MPFILYDYVDAKGVNEFKAWSKKLQPIELGKLNSKLDMLKLVGPAIRPVMLAGTGIGGLEKLKIKGKTQLRPLLTEGPINNGAEFTLLFGAREIGDEWSPKDALDQAKNRKATLKKDPNRRIQHERVS